MNKKYIVFDFDGTLVNTNNIIIESWQAAARRFLGHEVPEEDIIRTFGETLPYTVSYLMPGEDVMEVCDFHKEFQKQHCEGIVYVFDGMVELLRELKERGHSLAVATSRRRISFYEYMEMFNILDYFDVTVVMEDVKHHKPHPESLLVALDKLGAKPEEAIMVGDTIFDIGCANNANVESILIKWSHYIDENQFEEAGFVPTYLVEKPEDILDIV